MAEFLITAIEVDGGASSVRTDVRYDIVGSGPDGLAGRARGAVADDLAARRGREVARRRSGQPRTR